MTEPTGSVTMAAMNDQLHQQQGHAASCCPPEDCDGCAKPIEPGQGWARVTTTIYTPDHEPLTEHWRDFHHDPAVYEHLTREPEAALLDRITGARPGSCLFHSQES